MDEIHSLEVTKFDLVPAEFGGHNIVLKMIKALDERGRYLKFLKLQDAFQIIHTKPVKFKKQ